MSKFPTPTEEGHYWAKLVQPYKMPDGEDWLSGRFEVVQVYDNNGTGEDQWRVAMCGIERGQLIDAFVWGPKVPEYKPSN
jgi:hypothetical protein